MDRNWKDCGTKRHLSASIPSTTLRHWEELYIKSALMPPKHLKAGSARTGQEVATKMEGTQERAAAQTEDDTRKL